ncbi:hypothetical protein AAX22_01895 [Oenococcus oeni]|nr:hypothetical protein AAX22_01895 [Oenococcus oeni]
MVFNHLKYKRKENLWLPLLIAKPISLTLKNITVLFKNQRKEVRAVDNVNLAVERGDIFGIIGYSGAGKSTLVRTINLLQKPTNGSVIVNGIDIKKNR